MRGDHPVHQRLREGRVVGLVVAVAAVADEVDDDVALERVAERRRQPRRLHRGLRVVAVDVEHRRLDDLRDVAGVAREAVVLGRGGEADLVVDDDVDGAAGAVGGELGQRQRLGDEPLAGERRVAVDQQRHHRRAVGVVACSLLGAHDAFDDRIDGFEVARVGAAARRAPCGRRASCDRARSRGGTSRRRRPGCRRAGRCPRTRRRSSRTACAGCWRGR